MRVFPRWMWMWWRGMGRVPGWGIRLRRRRCWRRMGRGGRRGGRWGLGWGGRDSGQRAAWGGVLVRDQRDERPCDLGAGARAPAAAGARAGGGAGARAGGGAGGGGAGGGRGERSGEHTPEIQAIRH